MRAVMWTEVWQMLIIFVGMFFCLGSVVVGLPDSLSLSSALRIVGSTGRLATIDFNPDPKITYTFWTGLVGGIFLMLSYFGCDQSQVQRYLTGRSLSESRLSLLLSALLKIPMQFVILLTGAMLFVFYQFEKPPVVFNRVELQKLEASPRADEYRELAQAYDRAFEERRRAAEALAAAGESSQETARTDFLAADVRLQRARRGVGELISEMNGTPFNDTNYVFPTFVLTYLPVGMVGLILVAIFAAAMSTVESELNSLSTATVVDFYRRYLTPSASDEHYLVVSRIATVAWGGAATFSALYMGRLGSAIEVVNRIGSFFYGSILGVFVLAISIRRATGRGAFWGLAAGMVAVGLTSQYSEISYLYYNIVGCAVVVIVGYLISLTSPSVSIPRQ
jgi:Na+/proline symporter